MTASAHWWSLRDVRPAAGDERGCLRLLGRVADVVKVDGVKIHPIVVEQKIISLPGVRDAAVYGVRDQDGSDHLHAAVDPGAAIDGDTIRTAISDALSVTHSPEKIHFLSAMPLDSNGKPDKVLLRSRT